MPLIYFAKEDFLIKKGAFFQSIKKIEQDNMERLKSLSDDDMLVEYFYLDLKEVKGRLEVRFDFLDGKPRLPEEIRNACINAFKISFEDYEPQ